MLHQQKGSIQKLKLVVQFYIVVKEEDLGVKIMVIRQAEVVEEVDYLVIIILE